MDEMKVMPVVGYAFVPIQVIDEIYSVEKALEIGTMFPELNLPMEVYVPRQGGVQG